MAGKAYDSGLVMYPAGHARNTTADLHDILANKFRVMGSLAGDADSIVGRFEDFASKSAKDVATVHDFDIAYKDDFDDAE